jgi:hypothetical protein
MKVTNGRLFAVQLGMVSDEIDHLELHRRAELLLDAMRRLLQGAALRGGVKLVHAALETKRVVYVDATSALAQQASLWTGPDGRKVSSEDAAEQVIDNARRELRRFAASKQALNLARVIRVVDQCSSATSSAPQSTPAAATRADATPTGATRTSDRSGVVPSVVVQAIEHQPGGRIDGECRDGEFSLVAESSPFYLKDRAPMRVIGRVLSLGASKATFRIDKRSHSTMSVSFRAEVPLLIEAAHRDEGQLLRLYREYVLTERRFEVLAHLRHDTRSGRVVEVITAGPLFP